MYECMNSEFNILFQKSCNIQLYFKMRETDIKLHEDPYTWWRLGGWEMNDISNIPTPHPPPFLRLTKFWIHWSGIETSETVCCTCLHWK